MLNVCIEQESIGIVTSHMYSRPGLIPMPDEISGGKAMRLFPSIQIMLKKTSIKNADKKVIGNEITATTVKNRVYPPFQEATVSIDYLKGINPYAGLIDLGVTAGLIEKAGSWYSYKDEKLGQGYDTATESIGKHPRLLDEINKWLETTKYSNINEQLRLAEDAVDAVLEAPDVEIITEEYNQNDEDTTEVVEEKEEIKPKKKVAKKQTK